MRDLAAIERHLDTAIKISREGHGREPRWVALSPDVMRAMGEPTHWKGVEVVMLPVGYPDGGAVVYS